MLLTVRTVLLPLGAPVAPERVGVAGRKEPFELTKELTEGGARLLGAAKITAPQTGVNSGGSVPPRGRKGKRGGLGGIADVAARAPRHHAPRRHCLGRTPRWPCDGERGRRHVGGAVSRGLGKLVGLRR